LASELDIGKVAIGALLNRLETDFVMRRADSGDRRLKRVYLTARANSLSQRDR
jgi:DNA-binding MarR family transcriptional regulator